MGGECWCLEKGETLELLVPRALQSIPTTAGRACWMSCAGLGMPSTVGVPAVRARVLQVVGAGAGRKQPRAAPAGKEGQEAGINPRKGRLAPAGLGCSGWSRGREGRRRERNAQGLSQASVLLQLCRRPRLGIMLRALGAAGSAQPQR